MDEVEFDGSEGLQLGVEDGEDTISLEEESLSFDPSEIDSFELDLADLREQQGIQYPAVLLSGVLFMDCLRVLKARKRSSYREMDTWIELPGESEFKNIGTLQMDSEMLLTLRMLHIGVTIYYSSEEIEVLDLNNPEVLERFI